MSICVVVIVFEVTEYVSERQRLLIQNSKRMPCSNFWIKIACHSKQELIGSFKSIRTYLPVQQFDDVEEKYTDVQFMVLSYSNEQNGLQIIVLKQIPVSSITTKRSFVLQLCRSHLCIFVSIRHKFSERNQLVKFVETFSKFCFIAVCRCLRICCFCFHTKIFKLFIASFRSLSLSKLLIKQSKFQSKLTHSLVH